MKGRKAEEDTHKILDEFEHMNTRACTRRVKREFERARTAEENNGKEAVERHDRLRFKKLWQKKRERES